MLSVGYRALHGTMSEFLKSFESMLCYSSETRLKSCVDGDFDINIAWETSRKRDFFSLLKAAGFCIYIAKPTRITLL